MGRRDKNDNKSLKVGMSIFIAVIMVMSVFGIIIGSQSNEMKFGKYKFTISSDNKYVTKINGNEVYFYTLPTDNYFLNVANSTLEKLRSATFIALTYNPNNANESAPAIELAQYDMQVFMKDKMIVKAIAEESSLYSNVPILDCRNASSVYPVIMFNVSDLPGIVESGDCIYFNGKGADFLRIRDKVLYSYFGVLDE